MDLRNELKYLNAEFERFRIISRYELDELKHKRTKAEELLLLLSIDKFNDIGRISDLLEAEVVRAIGSRGVTVSIFENIKHLVTESTDGFSGEELEQLGNSLADKGEEKKKAELIALSKKKKKQANRPMMRDGAALKGRIDGRRLYEDEVN